MNIARRLEAVAALMARAEADRTDSPEDLDVAVARLSGFMESRAYNEFRDVIPQPENGWQGWTHTGRDDCPRCREATKVYWQTVTRSLITATITIERDLRDAAPITWRRWWTDTPAELPCREPTFDTLTVGQ